MQVRDVFCTFWVYSAMARAFAKFKQTVDCRLITLPPGFVWID
jgi:hypothetical protein